MKILQSSVLLLSILLLCTLAHGKKKRVKDTRPVVAVMNLKVDSQNPQVQAKVTQLTAKIRDEVADQIDSCRVLRTQDMKSLWRKNRVAIEKCYEDCDTEMAILFGAQFLIVGQLEPSQSEVVATLEIIDARTRNPLSTKKVKGGNYFEIESSILSTIKKFVRPLDNIVMQAKDDEVVAGEIEPEQDEDETGLGAGPQPASPNAQGPSTQASDSEYVPPPDDSESALSGREQKWEDSQNAPRLEDSEGWAFIKNQAPKRFGVGVNLGYPIATTNAYGLRSLLRPILHIGAQLYYQFHTLFQVALVADFDIVQGKATLYQYPEGEEEYPGKGTSERFSNENGSNTITYEVEFTNRQNYYSVNKYFTAGIRPTFRLTLPIYLAEILMGVGMGFNYVTADGVWLRSRVGMRGVVNEAGIPVERVTQETAYKFEQSGFGFYGVIEAGLILHFLDKRLGVGALMQYKKPSMLAAGTKVKAIPQPAYANRPSETSAVTVDGETVYSDDTDYPFKPASQSDVMDTPLKHLDSLNLLTIGLLAEWKF